MGTYSFTKVNASITGPGGSFSIGAGAGNSEEGITVAMLEDKSTMTIGADGSVMHSLHASNGARVTIRLLKTSPVNAQLNALYNFQKSSPALWGVNTLVISDTIRGDVIASGQVAFAKQADVNYAKEGGTMEWAFFGSVEEVLGTGVPDVNV